MRKKKHSIRHVLQIVNFLLLISMFLAFTLYFVVRETAAIRYSVFQTVERKAQQISDFIDDEVEQLTTVALNVTYSNLVKERFAVYAADGNAHTPLEKYKYVENTKVLTDMLTAIIGPAQPASQIYLYSLSGQRFGVGKSNATTRVELEDMPWYHPLFVAEKSSLVYCAPDDTIDAFFTIQQDLPFISFCSLYYNNLNQIQGVIEVKSPMTDLGKRIASLGAPYNETVYLYDSSGQYVCLPGEEDMGASARNYYSAIHNAVGHGASPGSGSGILELENDTLFYAVSGTTGFMAVGVVSNHQMMMPIYSYIRGNVLILAVIALAAFLLSFVTARLITNPVIKIYNEVHRIPDILLSTDESTAFQPIATSLVEIDTLYSSLIDMQAQMRQAMAREATLHRQESQARMLALQSQMNPHFLHNSLTTILSMADEGMNEQIQDMCRTISSILRYISSDKELLVPLHADLRHTTDYLRCMKMRYMDDLEYHIGVPQKMMDIPIPKLCLQPIVENSIKFTTQTVKPPWKITISASVSKREWKVRISDNGEGFRKETIDELSTQMKTIDRTGLLPSLELDGMGLLNIYIRLRLLYPGKQIFQICNAPEGGAVVMIGGIIDVQ